MFYELLILAEKYLLLILVYFFLFKIFGVLRENNPSEELPAKTGSHLKVITSDDKITTPEVERISLERGVRIGRAARNDICIDDPFVSSFHCKILRQGKDYFLQDLNSKNGVYCNDEKVTYVKLEPGAHIKINKVVLEFCQG